ncbi:MAG: helix-turn-helix domain-containing protein [Lachnospiraceae bacterium]|nr:helix-turn-helix domain-containing protein [Lachnospiraceae bacterium]
MKSSDTILKSKRYIEENLETPLTVSKIASAMGYTEFHFSRMFKKNMGISVMKYVQRRRLIMASEAILNGTKIIDAAYQYGWQSPSGFTKSFKREFGFAPSLLRASQIVYLEWRDNMNNQCLKTTEEHATKEELLEILWQEMLDNKIAMEREELEKIYGYADMVYNGLKRYSGDDYITHTLNVAILLAIMNAEKNVIIAGLFCDATSKTNITCEELRKKLPKESVKILEALESFTVFDEALPDGIILVKLAERLHNMRTAGYMDKEKMKLKAKETIDFFIPMAQKLGNEKLISELNDLSLLYL